MRIMLAGASANLQTFGQAVLQVVVQLRVVLVVFHPLGFNWYKWCANRNRYFCREMIQIARDSRATAFFFSIPLLLALLFLQISTLTPIHTLSQRKRDTVQERIRARFRCLSFHFLRLCLHSKYIITCRNKHSLPSPLVFLFFFQRF